MIGKFKKGFTLIELLIVIAIIGILTVAFLPTLRGGQSLARDAARKELVNSLAIVLENAIASGNAIPGNMTDGLGDCLYNDGQRVTNDLKQLLGRPLTTWPEVTKSGTTDRVCSTADAGSSLWYKKFNDASYLIVVQMENAKNANVIASAKVEGANVGVVNSPDPAAALAFTGAAPDDSSANPFMYLVTR